MSKEISIRNPTFSYMWFHHNRNTVTNWKTIFRGIGGGPWRRCTWRLFLNGPLHPLAIVPSIQSFKLGICCAPERRLIIRNCSMKPAFEQPFQHSFPHVIPDASFYPRPWGEIIKGHHAEIEFPNASTSRFFPGSKYHSLSNGDCDNQKMTFPLTVRNWRAIKILSAKCLLISFRQFLWPMLIWMI